MKNIIPNKVSRQFGKAVLNTQKNSPKILLVAGIVGAVGSTVLACRATLKVEDEVVIPAERALSQIRNGDRPREDITKVYIETAGKLTKLYGPSVVMGALSIFALTKSHSIMSKRNAGLTAAYAAIDQAFTQYRARVAQEFGEDKEREIRYAGQPVDVITGYDGKGNPVIETEIKAGGDASGYAKWFDQSNRNWEPNASRNKQFISFVEDWANSKLCRDGHLFLNEVYDQLGMPHTTEGAVVGWLFESGEGDGFVDFSIFDGNRPAVNHFFNGPNGSILLDFNVDGVIFRDINKEK